VTQLLNQTEITRYREMTLQEYGTAHSRGKLHNMLSVCLSACLPASLTPGVVVTAPAGCPNTVLQDRSGCKKQQRSDDVSAFSEVEVKKESAW
jgi:hypothetical protein